MTKQQNSKKWVTILIIVAVIAIAAAITISEQTGGVLPTWEEIYSAAGLSEQPAAPTLKVHFIDVGQGDSIFVEAPDGNILIDGGERGNENTIISYINKYGEDTLDYVVATHPHSDHIGSLDNVIDAFTVKNVIMPRLTKSSTPTTQAYKNLLSSVKKSGAKVLPATVGQTFSLGDLQGIVLAPVEQTDDLNNMSVVLRLDYGESSFLFTGDAETASEKLILSGEYASYVDVDVLKLGHHGSSTSSGSKFLSAVSPAFSVISCGAGNDYGHPHKETMQKLSKMDTKVLRTDEMGSIRIMSDGTNLTWECDNG